MFKGAIVNCIDALKFYYFQQKGHFHDICRKEQGYPVPAKIARGPPPPQALLVKEWLVSVKTHATSNNVRIEK